MHVHTTSPPDPTAPAQGTEAPAEREALWLSWFTVLYNLAEGGIAVTFALLAGSPALLGFGVDSFVEALSAGIIVWHFLRRSRMDVAQRDVQERRAVRLVGWALLALAVYVSYESLEKLFRGQPPQESIAGVIIAVVSLAVMLGLYWRKRVLAERLHSHSLAADAKQTLACMLLSVALLAGLGIHSATGFWQADPLAALLIAAWVAREGVAAVRHQELCCGTPAGD
jgi:divalent metal cation (Fe/Co/Zn/Cd) transporter